MNASVPAGHRRVAGVNRPALVQLALALAFSVVVGRSIAHGQLFVLVVASFVLPLAVIVRRPFVGALLLVMMVPFEALFAIGNGSTLLRVYGFPIAGIWLASSIMARRRMHLPLGWKIILAILIWDSLTIFWAADAGVSGARVLTEVQLALLYWMISDLVTTEREARSVIEAFGIGCVGAAAIALSQLGESGVYRISLTNIDGGGAGRFAHLMALGLVVSTAALTQFRGRKLWLLGAAACALAIITSATKGPIVAAAGASLVVWLWPPGVVRAERRRMRFLVSLAGALVAGLVLTHEFRLVSESALARLTPEFAVSSEGSGRLDFWRVGAQMVRERPLTGVGLDNFPEVYSSYAVRTAGLRRTIIPERDPHSDYLARVAGTGLVGFGLHASFLAACVIALAQRRRFVRTPTARFAWTVGLGMVVVNGLSSLTGTYQWQKQYWLGFAVAAVIHRLYPANASGRREARPSACRGSYPS